MGSIISHIYDIEKLYGSYDHYLAETKADDLRENEEKKANNVARSTNQEEVIQSGQKNSSIS